MRPPQFIREIATLHLSHFLSLFLADIYPDTYPISYPFFVDRFPVFSGVHFVALFRPFFLCFSFFIYLDFIRHLAI